VSLAKSRSSAPAKSILDQRLGRYSRTTKDSAGDLTTHQEFLRTKGSVLNGCDTTTVYALMAGATGAIWGGANYMPHEAVKLYDLVVDR